MKAFEFQANVKPDSTLNVPTDVASQVQGEQRVRVILLISEPGEDADSARLTSEQFLKGYAESDSIYDELSKG